MRFIYYFSILLLLISCIPDPSTSSTIQYKNYIIGEPIDELNEVKVYYNGDNILQSQGKHNVDGYYCGKKWQCVEFIKRYYFLHLKHEMPNGYGHASSFHNKNLKDNSFNTARGLKQFKNPSSTKPKVDDIIVWGGRYGHVAIVSKVTNNKVEVIQQNVGLETRAEYPLQISDGKYFLNGGISGWLRK